MPAVQAQKDKKLPVFIKIEEYKDLLDAFELIKRKLKDAKAILAELEDIKAREASELENWQAILSDIENRINELDDILLEPGVE
ncbi:MAG: hypothetical protein QXW00_03060 [Candidatus Woesearchaeota archaeon]